MSHPDREPRVSTAFVALADTLVDDYDTIDLLDTLVGHCVDLLAADAAGLLLADPQGDLRVAATSGEDAETMELLQLQAGEGPCMEAYLRVTQVRIPDLADEAGRWPSYVAAVLRAGAFRSVHAVPLRLRGQAIGALNLLHRTPGPLPDADLALAQALADVATIGILSERAIRRGEVLAEQLQTALDSRVVIEQAKGITAQTLGIGVDEAFSRLRHHARSHNLRLGELARRTVTGEFDPAGLPAGPSSAATAPRRRPGTHQP